MLAVGEYELIYIVVSQSVEAEWTDDGAMEAVVVSHESNTAVVIQVPIAAIVLPHSFPLGPRFVANNRVLAWFRIRGCCFRQVAG